MLCNSLATWFAILYKRAVLSPYHITSTTARAFFRSLLRLDHISHSVHNQCLKKPWSPKKQPSMKNKLFRQKSVRATCFHIIAAPLHQTRYAVIPPTETRKKYFCIYVSHTSSFVPPPHTVLFQLLGVLLPHRQTAVVRCPNVFPRSHFPESFQALPREGVTKCDLSFFLGVH